MIRIIGHYFGFFCPNNYWRSFIHTCDVIVLCILIHGETWYTSSFKPSRPRQYLVPTNCISFVWLSHIIQKFEGNACAMEYGYSVWICWMLALGEHRIMLLSYYLSYCSQGHLRWQSMNIIHSSFVIYVYFTFISCIVHFAVDRHTCFHSEIHVKCYIFIVVDSFNTIYDGCVLDY